MHSIFPNCKSIAVVGNSACELGARKGTFIDTYDLVIRFNNFSLAPQFVQDYGSKVDYWANSFNRDIVFEGRISNAIRIICGYPLNKSSYLERYQGTSVASLIMYQSNVEFIPVELFEELVTLEANPSSGLAVLYWIHRTRGIRRNDVFGFSCFNHSTAHHYFDEDRRCFHNGRSESRILASILA